ncbi:serrate RNA effector molecule homolog isoform X2 [Chiloscyllium plagiosum]|uniref:serrate RNA effector molecule homolog isoform X2 n=1 Tax=Chiloscyllium plagiosum TaxID=36176 RepID=UPI001CB85F91|nr:serrate RNA effector molecule homolog isoform X2 [Chiloscyllium plagiosum]
MFCLARKTSWKWHILCSYKQFHQSLYKKNSASIALASLRSMALDCAKGYDMMEHPTAKHKNIASETKENIGDAKVNNDAKENGEGNASEGKVTSGTKENPSDAKESTNGTPSDITENDPSHCDAKEKTSKRDKKGGDGHSPSSSSSSSSSDSEGEGKLRCGERKKKVKQVKGTKGESDKGECKH